ncbi:MAG: acyl-CoA thioesterase [Flavobacteriales bacterium]
MVHKFKIRVRYSETDQMGRVYHGAYASYLEVARVEMLRSLGWNYRKMESQGLILPVRDLKVQFLKAVIYDQEIELWTTAKVKSPFRLVFEYDILVENNIVTKAQVELVGVNRDSQLISRLPDQLILDLGGIESD